MATVAKVTVSNATQAGSGHWIATQDVFGPQLIPSTAPRGPCIVEAVTSPANSPAEWSQILWTGGDPVFGRPNQRAVRRQTVGKTNIGAMIQGRGQQVAIWVIWATISIQTTGPRPPRAKSWSEGAMFTGGDSCGAFVVNSLTMGENARGQVVAVAKLEPAGVGRVIAAAAQAQLKFRREVTAHDFVDGKRFASKKAFVPWAGDDSLPQLLTLDPGPDDQLYDTDGPDLPSGVTSAETYNNFRQWLEWAGTPCSNYGNWYFQARWKGQKVTFKDVGQGAIQLPATAHYK